MERRTWKDPRVKRRFHVGSVKLEYEGQGFTLGRDVAINAGYVYRSDGLIPLGVAVFAPNSHIILREDIINRPSFDPAIVEREVEDSNKITPVYIDLGTRDGINNRVYVSDDLSLARVWSESGLKLVVASVDPNLEIKSHPPETNLAAKLAELRSSQ